MGYLQALVKINGRISKILTLFDGLYV
jgi:hypothetical protein